MVLSIRCLPAHDGPGGIRTLDLFSAIEARSQLRYRPDDRSKLQGKKILPEWGVNVKLRSKSMCAWVSTLPGQESATPACRVPCENWVRLLPRNRGAYRQRRQALIFQNFFYNAVGLFKIFGGLQYALVQLLGFFLQI